MKKKSLLCIIFTMCLSHVFAAPFNERADVKTFLNEMAQKHQFSKKWLTDAFNDVKIIKTTIKMLDKPYESYPWHRYKKGFVSQNRIEKGAAFWLENADLLEKAEKKYGVPAQIIVAILGVETRYGKQQGNIRVIDSLSTIAFEYPRRASYFKKELEQFLLLTHEQGIDPKLPKGSYAGAMGQAQFMPSSYRIYAVDANLDNKKDLLGTTSDAIYSIGNYLKEKGWKEGERIVSNASVSGKIYETLKQKYHKPTLKPKDFKKYGISTTSKTDSNTLYSLVTLEGETGNEFYLGHYNFYTIIRYNPSSHYAMAVHDLALKIKTKYAALKSQKSIAQQQVSPAA